MFCVRVYFLKPRLFPSERLMLTPELSNRLQLIYCLFLNSFVLFCDAQRKKAPRGLVGALIQRHLGFPDDALTRVATMLLFTVVVVAVFVVVVAVVANDDVTIVTCVCLLFTCSGCRAGLPPSPPGAFCSWHARALVRLLGAAFQDGGAV